VSRFILVPGLLLVAACNNGGGSANNVTGPTQVSYDNIAGTYAGPIGGLSQGITLSGTLTVTITQSGGTLGGSTALAGSLSQSGTVVQVTGSGPLTGSIASGHNPSVSVTASNGLCPNVPATWNGAYDDVNRVLTLNGSLYILNTSCQIVLTYTGTVIFK